MVTPDACSCVLMLMASYDELTRCIHHASAKRATLDYHALWKIDVRTGEISFPKTQKRYLPLETGESNHTPGKRSPVTRCK